MKELKEFESILDFKRYAKNLVAENLDSAFQSLRPIVEQNSDLYNNWILYKGRHKDTQKFFNQNIFNKDKLDIERNKVRSSILQLIDSLSESDFQNMQLEVHLNEKLQKIQLELEGYEEKVKNLTLRNSEIQKDKERFYSELEKQKKLNDNKIKELQLENEKLKNLAENYEQTKIQVQNNEKLIGKLKNENYSLNESNRKLSQHEITIQKNLNIIQNLKDEKEKLFTEVKSIREQEKTLIANKTLIEKLKNENLDLKDKIFNLKNELQEVGHYQSDDESQRLNKRLLYSGIAMAAILLIFSSIQFISNQRLNKKLFSLNEQVEEYQYKEADEEISKAKISSNDSTLNLESDSMDKDDLVNSKIVNTISFEKEKIKVGQQSRIIRLYKIKRDEGVIRIAKKFNMTLEEIKSLNPEIKNINDVKSGKFIRIYDIVKYMNYTIKPRESLKGIAGKYRMWSDEIMKINDITNPNVIKSGQRLIVFKSKYH